MVLKARWISLWGRWFIWLVVVFLIAYRPGFWYPQQLKYLALPVVQLMVNGLIHYRLLTWRSVTQRWLFLLSVTDVVQITFAVVVGGGFPSFAFLAFYPALGLFAVIFSSLWATFAWTSLAALTYALVCVLTGPGLDLGVGQEKVLVGRLAAMYTVALGIGLITRFERLRWQAAVSREQGLRRERIELSQKIHDTVAQTSFMINLGIHRARALPDDSNEDLVSALEATSSLSKSAMWEIRGPIDAGHIHEGRELGRVLWSHCDTFERITSVPTELNQSGIEPPPAMGLQMCRFRPTVVAGGKARGRTTMAHLRLPLPRPDRSDCKPKSVVAPSITDGTVRQVLPLRRD